MGMWFHRPAKTPSAPFGAVPSKQLIFKEDDFRRIWHAYHHLGLAQYTLPSSANQAYITRASQCVIERSERRTRVCNKSIIVVRAKQYAKQWYRKSIRQRTRVMCEPWAMIGVCRLCTMRVMDCVKIWNVAADNFNKFAMINMIHFAA